MRRNLVGTLAAIMIFSAGAAIAQDQTDQTYQDQTQTQTQQNQQQQDQYQQNQNQMNQQDRTGTESDRTMPDTASPMGLIAAMGVIALSAGAGIYRRRG